MDLMIKPLSITDVEEAAAMEDVAFSSINIQKEDVDAEVLARKEVVRGLLTNPSSTAIVIDVTYMVTESRIALNVRALDKIALTLFYNSTSFVLDSGRTSHMCASGSKFNRLNCPVEIEVADGKYIHAVAVGSIGMLNNVYYVPQLRRKYI